MAVVKAGAYGHGLEEMARAVADENIAFFGVANVGEARRLMHAGIKTRIYLLGATWAEERAEIVEHQWTPCISSVDEALHFNELAAEAGIRLNVHISVDTGMGRGGFVATDLPAALPTLESLEHLHLEGIGSHLSSADEDDEFTRKQIACYNEAIEALGGAERFKWRHLSNSAGILAYPSGCCNLARPGLILYGVSPIPEYQAQLRNVMSLRSRITLIRTLPAGHGVSYGHTFTTTKPTRVATVGIGYGDGYPRHLSGQSVEVAIHGKRYPMIGRVTMDQMMVDVTGSDDVKEGDIVELFGPTIPAAEIAAKADTIVWHVFTGITPRVVRMHR